MAGGSGEIAGDIKWFVEVPLVYLHRDFVDFRKAINGLVLIKESQMELSPYEDALAGGCFNLD